MEAYSTETGITYDSWDDLLAAETSGYVVVLVSERPKTAPMVVGPFSTQVDARRAQIRLQRRGKREEAPYNVRTHVRPLWRDDRKPLARRRRDT